MSAWLTLSVQMDVQSLLRLMRSFEVFRLKASGCRDVHVARVGERSQRCQKYAVPFLHSQQPRLPPRQGPWPSPHCGSSESSARPTAAGAEFGPSCFPEVLKVFLRMAVFKTSLKQSWKLPTPLSFSLSLSKAAGILSSMPVSPPSQFPLPLALPGQYQHPPTIGGNLLLVNNLKSMYCTTCNVTAPFHTQSHTLQSHAWCLFARKWIFNFILSLEFHVYTFMYSNPWPCHC